jgi:hypothetical protein
MGSGDYSPNSTIIPLSGRNKIDRPRSIINAISEIQQYYVIENQGQDIPSDFFTLEASLDLTKVGMRSGFHEAILVLFLFPVFTLWLVPFVFNESSKDVQFVIGSVPYLGIFINTLLCLLMGRYYVGKITRNAINSFYLGRTMILFFKGILFYVLFQLLYTLSTPDNVWKVVDRFKTADKIYDGYFEHVYPKLLSLGKDTAILMCFAAIVPYIVSYAYDKYRQRKIKRNLERISNIK